MPWSKKQIGAIGSGYGAKKKGKGKPPKTPASIWAIPMGKMEEMLHEGVKGKKSKKVRRKK